MRLWSCAIFPGNIYQRLRNLSSDTDSRFLDLDRTDYAFTPSSDQAFLPDPGTPYTEVISPDELVNTANPLYDNLDGPAFSLPKQPITGEYNSQSLVSITATAETVFLSLVFRVVRGSITHNIGSRTR